MSSLRSAGIDADELTLKGLKAIHDRMPHPPPLGKENLS